MRKFNILIAVNVLFFCCLSFAVYVIFNNSSSDDKMYMAEANEIMKGLENSGEFSSPDLHLMNSIQRVEFLNAGNMNDINEIEHFYKKVNKYESIILPFIQNGELKGLIKFYYKGNQRDFNILYNIEAVIILYGIFFTGFLLYIKTNIINPFIKLADMPYELSKGHLEGEMEENKNKFFGRFIWGINMLRDNLKASKAKELKLEKEKKMLLLSISHDIKTPISTIKLYAKALREGIYDTDESKTTAAVHIEERAKEIEEFIGDIVRASSEDILNIEVINSEFYLGDLADKIYEYYRYKCELKMIDFKLGKYENKILKGDFDRAFEVIENIMENAFKYGDGRKIRITFCEEEYCQLIKISNTGLPIEKSEIPHLFDSFFRGSNVKNNEGNGLGLYICREIMRKMDGDIFAEREDNKMTFVLVFR